MWDLNKHLYDAKHIESRQHARSCKCVKPFSFIGVGNKPFKHKPINRARYLQIILITYKHLLRSISLSKCMSNMWQESILTADYWGFKSSHSECFMVGEEEIYHQVWLFLDPRKICSHLVQPYRTSGMWVNEFHSHNKWNTGIIMEYW